MINFASWLKYKIKEARRSAFNEGNDNIAELAARLHQTQDAIAPAVRMEKGRGFLQWVTGSSVKLHFILSTVLLISIAGNCLLGWFAVHPVREYFATDNGRLFPLIPLSQPYRKAADVIQYAKDTINRSFTLDFLNWRQQLEEVRADYTKDGFKSFIASLQSSGALETIRVRRMNMSITAGTGVLLKEGIQSGV